MEASIGKGLLSFLAEIPDPRSRHGRRHTLPAILALVCCAVMSGACGDATVGQWGEDQEISWIHQLGFHRKPPKSGGIRKVLMALDMKVLEAALTRWAEATLGRPVAIESVPLEAFALDGKTARGSCDGMEKAVHLLSLMAQESGLTVAQMAVPSGVEDKTNEHKAALQLLGEADLTGRVITGDAMFSQRDLSQQILDDGGHFLWFVKENQPTLRNDIQAALAPPQNGAFSPSTATHLG
jgi:DDE_Tnp_1-associated/Transposase DDE domain